MSNLLATLRSSAHVLESLAYATGVTQNNISNAGTPGYTRQRATFQARVFDPANGLAGGVQLGPVQTTRDRYVERSVRTQISRTAAAETRSTELTRLEQVLRLSSGDSIPTALNRFYAAASAWAVAPEDFAAKENILITGEGVASAIRGVAQELSVLTADNEAQIRAAVDAVNGLVGRIRDYNTSIRTGAVDDAGIDAGIHATLDELSQHVDLQASQQEDGSYTLLLDGQYPLVVADQQYDLKVSFEVPEGASRPGAATRAVVRIGTGYSDRTAEVNGARLGSLLEFRHEALASIQGDSTKEGELEQLARTIVDRLNDTWPPPAAPFLVAGSSPVSIAHTLSINPTLKAAMLSAVEPGPPTVANGKALQITALVNPAADDAMLGGLSFTTFYGKIASKVGSQLNEADFDKQSQNLLKSQAEAFREHLSGVSLDEEALHLLEFQRAYEASARLVTVLDEMLEMAVNLGHA